MPFIQLIKANTRMEFIEMKRYLPNTLSMIATIYIIFLGMLLGINVIGDPAQAEANIQHVIVNYIFWYLTLVTLTNIGFTITMEATRGTLRTIVYVTVRDVEDPLITIDRLYGITWSNCRWFIIFKYGNRESMAIFKT